MRRQHSCDQCRRSKRACDAPSLARRESGATIASDEVDASKTRPCSYCLRTKKKCTMDWARSQLRTRSTSSRGLGQIPQKRLGGIDTSSSWPSIDSVEEHFDLGPAGFSQDTEMLSLFQEIANPSLDMPSALPSEPLDQFEFGTLLETPDFPDIQDDDYLAISSATNPTSGMNGFAPAHMQISSRHPTRGCRTKSSSKRRRSSGLSDNQSSLTSFSIDQTLMVRSNNQLISTNLLQIYHDVFEHNLSCWLTEVNCPYETPRWSADVTQEWGPSWSNRIYRRTIQLDRVAQSTKMIQLDRSEVKAAVKALHLAIMAFATQWAQGSHRQRERYLDGQSQADDLAAEMTDEFDRNLQRHFWHQAQKALQEVSELESYRVICAELIFGLTQKPWMNDDDQPSVVDPTIFSNRRRAGNIKMLAMSQINGIMAKEGPPTYMERAARKMHALKYRYDSMRRGLDDNGSHGMSIEDKGTIGLLYWLAVMFDTVSSSMNARPVVVSDESCPQVQDDVTEGETLNGRWKIDTFIRDNLDHPGKVLHWPCSYEVAAEAVTKSAPVKVLLFRHVSYLQDILRKGGRGQMVEEIIRSTTSVYRYWNISYGAFFKELVQNFSAVPPRVQGWFVCISAHWHLAALMLADLIDFVDEHGLGIDAEAQSRSNSQMARRIRESSVRELSDLASVATPPKETASPPQLPEFHHAVNEGTILTEPWTIILIRAFSKASVVLLGEADESLRYGRGTLGHGSESFADSLERAEECIKALWLLGKKSDMARKIAEVLAVASSGLQK